MNDHMQTHLLVRPRCKYCVREKSKSKAHNKQIDIDRDKDKMSAASVCFMYMKINVEEKERDNLVMVLEDGAWLHIGTWTRVSYIKSGQ